MKYTKSPFFKGLRFLIALTLSLCVPFGVVAQGSPEQLAPVPHDEQYSVDQQLQQLKSDVLELNRDLYILKEELLFPANTQVAVFLSMDMGELFKLDSVQVEIDNKLVASFLYTDNQVRALSRGGMQRLYLGNVKAGSHEIVAVFNGEGPNGREYRRAASYRFDKNDKAKYIELAIKDSAQSLQPEFFIDAWE